MSNMSVTGATTVVDGAESEYEPNDLEEREREPEGPLKKTLTFADDPFVKGKQATSSRNARVHETFMMRSLEDEQDRPYFVKIGHDGVLPALARLDEALAKVCSVFRKPVS